MNKFMFDSAVHDTINELFLASHTMTIQWNAIVIYSWYLISRKLNFIVLIMNYKENYSTLCLLHSILYSFLEKPIRYPCVAKLIFSHFANINEVKFKDIILPISDTFLNEYTNSVWLFNVAWLYPMAWTTVEITVVTTFLHICICYIVCYSYNMCSQLPSLNHGNSLKSHNARSIHRFKRPVQIVDDKKTYCIFSWSISISFIYIAPIYHRARYLFRLLNYG